MFKARTLTASPQVEINELNRKEVLFMSQSFVYGSSVGR